MGLRSTGTRLGVSALLASLVCLPVGAGSAAVTAAPTAITGPVSAVGSTSATAGGTVNPGGQATAWYVEYGTSTSYGKQTSSKSAGSGTANVQVSATLTGLSPSTTYHYRVVATNGAGTSRGDDGIFTTTSGPVAVTGSASGVTATAATLAGTVDPNGRPTTWYFEYGTSTGYGSKTASKSAGSGTSSAAVSAPVSGLATGRVYHYRLVATSDAGTSRGADRTFTTAGAPVAVTGSVSAITTKSAKLAGTVNANGQTTSWYFEYGPTTSYGSKTSAKSLGAGAKTTSVSATVTGLMATAYHYRLVATNASGTSLGANRVFGTAGPPVARTGVALDIGPSTARPTATVNPQGRRTTWYFEYGTTTRYGSRTSSRSAGSAFGDQNVSAPISRLRTAVTYHYRVVARNDAGTTRGADLTFTTSGVSLNARARRVVYGRSVMLSGVVPTRRAGETVTLLALNYGLGSPRVIATVLTGDRGIWRYLARPTIRTGYTASWNGATSRELVVAVRPAVSFRRVGSARFVTRVVAAKSFAGRIVKLQRRTQAGRWVTIKRLRLNRRSAATFRVRLRKGTSRLRVVMSITQAGPGYLAGISRTIVYRRR
jgi:Fibronectin type III domain